MTAARQERKSRHFGAFAGGLCRDCARRLGLASTSIGAATTEWVVVNRYTGLAIDGFDPVAYFVDGAPKAGRAELELRSGGATWRFRERRQPRGLCGRARGLRAALRRPRSDGGGAGRGDRRDIRRSG